MKRLAVVLTRLYPASWRQRYGAEFEALLEQCPARPSVAANAAAGAAGAWLRWPALAGSASARLRGGLTAVLWGGLAVLGAGSGFVKSEIPAAHGSVRTVGAAMVGACVVAAACMGAGAVAPAVAVTRLAIAQHRRDVLRLVAAPPLAGIVFAGVAAGLARATRNAHVPAALGHSLFYVIVALFLAATVITGRAPSLALRRLDPGARVLRVSVPFGVLAVTALAAATGLMVAYAVMLDAYEPWLAHSENGPPWQHQPVLGQLILAAVVMALGTLLAATGLAQGTLPRHPAGRAETAAPESGSAGDPTSA